MKLTLKPLAKACALALVTGSVIAATPAATVISNQITATYSDAFSNSYTAESNVIELRIREVRTVDLVGDSSQTLLDTATEVETTHTLNNFGNIATTYDLTASNDAAGDTLDATDVTVYFMNADGSKGSIIDAPISLDMDASASFIVVSTLPAGLTSSDSLNVTLTATDTADNTVTDSNAITVTFSGTTEPTTPMVVRDVTNGGTCNSYTWVKTGAELTWSEANSQANLMVYQGKVGHLATPTTLEEDTFIIENVIAGYDAADNILRPWIGLNKPSGGSLSWVTGETLDYTAWNSKAGPGNRNVNNHNNVYYEIPTFGNGGHWGLLGGTTENHTSFVVEFETDCADLAPKVDVALTASKDLMCDGEADDAFGSVNLDEMASGECAIMRGNVKNNGAGQATATSATSVIPADTDYVADTLASCLGESCDVASLTDTAGDGAEYAVDGDGNGSVKFDFGDLQAGAEGTLQYQIKIK